ncbi:hypothetical protein QTO34_009208 [Cnephaeus nilssonii]|uniref:B box-type domain-containing protein n=1 Tax=Cnephaeus nilssonii TaxID=3371016 RepID=A0AA40HI47_CNENI|nr:hypothetical protein QTO34_009208 [Eptesicus nilssonii]
MEEQVLLRTHNALWQGPGERLRGLPAPAVLLRQEPRLRRAIHHQMSGQVAYPARPGENEKMHLPRLGKWLLQATSSSKCLASVAAQIRPQGSWGPWQPGVHGKRGVGAPPPPWGTSGSGIAAFWQRHGVGHHQQEDAGGGHLLHMPAPDGRAREHQLRPQLLPGLPPAPHGPALLDPEPGHGALLLPPVPGSLPERQPAAQQAAGQPHRRPRPSALRELEQELSCQEQGEWLHLFCEDESQLICLRCERDPRHQGLAKALMEDGGGGGGYGERLQEAVRKLRQMEEECTNQKAFTAKQIAEWNEKIKAQRQKIQADFQNLHRFPREEERPYLWRPEREKEHTLRRRRDSEANLRQQSRELQSRILELEEPCQGSAEEVLQDAVRPETLQAPSLETQSESEVPEHFSDLRKRLRSHQGLCEDDPRPPLSYLFERKGEGERDRNINDERESLIGRLLHTPTGDQAHNPGTPQANALSPEPNQPGLVRYFLNHLTELPGSYETDMEQFAKALNQAAEGDEATRRPFHGFVLFQGELDLPLEIEGAEGLVLRTAVLQPALQGLLDALLPKLCPKITEVDGPALAHDWTGRGKTDMDEVTQRIKNVAPGAPCSVDVRQMLLKLVELRSRKWGGVRVTSAFKRSSTCK